jgi:hypothetical protein
MAPLKTFSRGSRPYWQNSETVPNWIARSSLPNWPRRRPCVILTRLKVRLHVFVGRALRRLELLVLRTIRLRSRYVSFLFGQLACAQINRVEQCLFHSSNAVKR